MARLTAKQEKYVQGLVAGLSQREAYRKAYPNAVEWKDSAVDSNASTLLRSTKVSQRYDELMDEHKEKAMFTREDAINELIWLYKQSKESIESHDEGYVRQGTSGAMLGALDRLITLELLDPRQRLEYEKVKKELEGNEGQEDKISNYLSAVKGVLTDGNN